MKTDLNPLREVLSRFPEFEDRIRERFQVGGQFHELCTDYAECLKTLQRIRNQYSGTDERIEQYTELLVSLEQELAVKISTPANEMTAK